MGKGVQPDIRGIMMRSTMVFGLVLCVVGSACQDVVGPGARHLVPIGAIRVPPRAAATDTIWVSFVDGASQCDTGVVVAQERTPGGIRFTATSITRPGPCAAVPVIYKAPTLYGIIPPHAVPFTLAFAEPSRADSLLAVGP